MENRTYICCVLAVLLLTVIGCNNTQTIKSDAGFDTVSVDTNSREYVLYFEKPEIKMSDIMYHNGKLLHVYTAKNGIKKEFYQCESKSLYQLLCREVGTDHITWIQTLYDRYNEPGYEYYQYGTEGPFLYTTSPDNSNLYVLADIHPNSNGWVTKHQLFKIDCESLSATIIADCAGIEATPNGFTIAECRLVNEDTSTSIADQIWLIHDVQIDWNGNRIFDDKDNEYDYMAMDAKYSSPHLQFWRAKGFKDTNDIR